MKLLRSIFNTARQCFFLKSYQPAFLLKTEIPTIQWPFFGKNPNVYQRFNPDTFAGFGSDKTADEALVYFRTPQWQPVDPDAPDGMYKRIDEGINASQLQAIIEEYNREIIFLQAEHERFKRGDADVIMASRVVGPNIDLNEWQAEHLAVKRESLKLLAGDLDIYAVLAGVTANKNAPAVLQLNAF